MSNNLIPIKKIKKWNSEKEIIEFCKHILSHQERYEKSRIFEAKEVLNNLAL